jgi:hypothetical protein
MVSITGSPTGPGMKSSDRTKTSREQRRRLSILKHGSTSVKAERRF